MSKYQKFGEDDPHIQGLVYLMELATKRTMARLTETYGYDVSAAMLATSLGVVFGELQAITNEHVKDCEKCAKKNNHEYYELIVRNFGAAFGQAKANKEARFASGVDSADEFLNSVLKAHKKG